MNDRRHRDVVLDGAGLERRDARRTLYFTDAYLPYMASAAFFGALLTLGFLAFMLNVIQTFGIKTIVGLFMPAEVEG